MHYVSVSCAFFMIYVKESAKIVKKPRCLRTQQEKAFTFAPDLG